MSAQSYRARIGDVDVLVERDDAARALAGQADTVRPLWSDPQ